MMTIRVHGVSWALAGLLVALPLGAAAAEPLDLELAYTQNQLRRMEQPDLSRVGRWLAYEVFTPPEKAPGSDLEAEPRQDRLGRGIGFLAVDAPVTQVIEGDDGAGDRAADESARAHDPKVPVQIPDLRLASGRRPMIEPIEHVGTSGTRRRGAAGQEPRAQHNGSRAPAKPVIEPAAEM